MLQQYQTIKMNQMLNQMNMIKPAMSFPNQQLNYSFMMRYNNYINQRNQIQRIRTNQGDLLNDEYAEKFMRFQREINPKQKKGSFSAEDIEQKKIYSYLLRVMKINEDKIEEFENFIMSRKSTIIEDLCTQRGSKEIERLLKKSPNECITILINTVNVRLRTIMTDVYGNYFCQRVIKSASSEQVTLILKYISKDFVFIAKDYSGTHVLQAILDTITTEEQENIILTSIGDSVMEMAYDTNATHVLQKIIQRINEAKRENINKVILANIKRLSLDSNGICLVKKYITSNSINENKKSILKSLTENCLEIAQNPFGNYVIQCILEEWSAKECESVLKILIENICPLSKQKFSSNVVEKIIELSDINRKKEIFKTFFNENKIIGIIKNKFGKFVLQKSVNCMNREQRDSFMNMLEKLMETTGNKDKKAVSSFIETLRI